MSGGVARLIADFSIPSASEGFGLGMLRRVKAVVEEEPVRVQSAPDRQAELIRSAEAQARAEEREAARQQLKEALDAEREKHCEELAVQRELWVEQEAAQLSAQIVDSLGNLERILSDRVARILAPIIPEALQQKALFEFNEILGTILSGEISTVLKVTGPEDMLKAIRARFALREGIIEFVPSDDVEVTLVAGDTTIQTQLSSWSIRLKEALKAE
ncbi:hypothetical protein DC522_20995 [Microvirga sp. KLBC 81]|uniref:hypothetical protein n=1 Tax=Microvirga sp. KLBC 81 TaxID=1862707 RepID=UPI000D509363|nr:hypothetical protein [Microvirga sp. KLBC 81]PVE22473.1 hypothetical protein DC522_20995 [Microvirga sp. KLBC 81]